MTEKTTADDVTAVILEVFQLNGRLIESGNALVRDFDLTSARWQVLGALALSETPMTVPEIARAMGLTRQSVQRLANEMAETGIVRFKDNVRHKRSRYVVLTAKGKALHADTEKRQVPWAARLGAGISRTDIQTTLGVLRQIRSRLEENRR